MARTNTTNLNLVQPDRLDQYNVDDFNSNMKKIDDFAGLVPPRALTADKLTVGRNINGVLFDGSKNVITGLGLHSISETYAMNNIVYTVENSKVKLHKSKQDQNKGHATSENDWWEEVSLGGGMPVGLIVRSLASSVENGLYTNGTEFTKGQLPTFYNDWLIGGLIPTITYEQYQTELTMTGECWSVALDSARETFRVPFIKDEVLRDVKATTSANGTIPVKGNGITLGLTDGKDFASLTHFSSGGTGGTTDRKSLYGKPVGTQNIDDTRLADSKGFGVTADGSKSGLIADLSSGNISTNTSKQTKVIKHFLVVATGSIKQSEMDWSKYMDGLKGKLNKDFSNIDEKSRNIVNWSSNATNCIGEIPQDIKLEFKDGIVTLKAGSKIYKPDGSFFTINEDMSRNFAIKGTDKMLVFYNKENYLDGFRVNDCRSGETAPVGINRYAYWFDTKNNIMKLTTDQGASWREGQSLPIAQIVLTDGAITSIDQVFNGFGFIGNTMFVLPNVKALIPDGRNIDGSLKNKRIITNSIKIHTQSKSTYNGSIIIYPDGNIAWQNMIGEYQSAPPVVDWVGYFNVSENTWYFSQGMKKWEKRSYGVVASFVSDETGKITSFNSKQSFRALDYNDKSTISSWGMPSNKYVDLVLGSPNYTAPANGKFELGLRAGSGHIYAQIARFYNGVRVSRSGNTCTNGLVCETSLEVKRGDVITLFYGGPIVFGGDDQYFRFVYAEGEV